MARGTIPVTTSSFNGVARPAQTASDATNDHQFANDGKTIVEVENTNAGTQSVVFETAATVNGIPVEDVTVSLTTGQVKMCGPFPVRTFNQTGDVVYVNPSIDTDLKFRAYTVPSLSE